MDSVRAGTARGEAPLDAEVRQAFDAYIRARGHRLVRTAYLLTGDHQVAEDIVQNALASALTSWRRVKDVANLDAYLYAALVNARSRWWRRRWHGEIPAEILPEPPAHHDGNRYEVYDQLLTVLRTLPERQRAAVVLRYYEDLTEAQTAELLGCTVGTVKSQTARGLAKLRAALAAADNTGTRS
jgi:RNA polymerase sigma-70 factor (sigma-E family)